MAKKQSAVITQLKAKRPKQLKQSLTAADVRQTNRALTERDFDEVHAILNELRLPVHETECAVVRHHRHGGT